MHQAMSSFVFAAKKSIIIVIWWKPSKKSWLYLEFYLPLHPSKYFILQV